MAANVSKEDFSNVKEFYWKDVKNKSEIAKGGEAIIYTGNFGVYRNVAIKVWYKTEYAKEATNILKHSNHPNIVRFFGVVKEDSRLAGIVIEFMPNLTVSDAIHKKKIPNSMEQNFSWILQASYATEYLHSKSIGHRDLKPNNMLLGDNFNTLKICDFGLTKDYSNSNGTTTLGEGTYPYLAPEKLTESMGEKAIPFMPDIYALSICIWEIITRNEGKRPDTEFISDKDIVAFLQKGWDESPKKRHKIEEVIEFFEGKKPHEVSKKNNVLLEPEDQSIKEAIGHLDKIHIDATKEYNNETTDKDIKSLSSFFDNYKSICSIVISYFKEETERIQLATCITEVGNEIDELQTSYRETYSSLQDTIRRIPPWLSRQVLISWDEIDTLYDSMANFAKERKSKMSALHAFKSSCEELHSTVKKLQTRIDNKEWERLVKDYMSALDKLRKLENDQEKDEVLYKKYVNKNPQDRLLEIKSEMTWIEEQLIKYVLNYTNLVKTLDEDLNVCITWISIICNQTSIVNMEFFSDFFRKLTEQRNEHENAYKEVCELQESIEKMYLDAKQNLALKTEVELIRQRYSEVNEIYQNIKKYDELIKRIHELKTKIPEYSLMENIKLVVEDVEKYLDEELAAIYNDIQNIPYLTISLQLTGLIREQYESLKALVNATISENRKIRNLVQLLMSE